MIWAPGCVLLGYAVLQVAQRDRADAHLGAARDPRARGRRVHRAARAPAPAASGPRPTRSPSRTPPARPEPRHYARGMADVSVRAATAADAADDRADPGRDLAAGLRRDPAAPVLDALSVEIAAAAWAAAIAAPPTARHHVLVALEQAVAGRLRRARPGRLEPGPGAGATAAIGPLLVEPRWGRRGHGSGCSRRPSTMPAATGLTRRSPGCPRRDPASRAFFVSAGWAPDGPARAWTPAPASCARSACTSTTGEHVSDVHRHPDRGARLLRGPRGRQLEVVLDGAQARYDESVRAPLEALATALEPEFGPAKLFRPYRDVRFAKDKSPYKTHQGAWFGESVALCQVSAAGLFVAGGYWETATPTGRTAAAGRRRRRRRRSTRTRQRQRRARRA